MINNLNLTIRVLDMTDAGCCVMRTTAASTGEAFWLPRNGQHATFVDPPELGKLNVTIVSGWLAKRHRQIVGDAAYEDARDQRRARQEYAAPVSVQPTQPQEAPMAFEQRDNRGVLFRVDPEKRENDRWPEYEGSIVIDGRKYYISAWVKTSEKSGKKFLSLAAKPAEEKAAPKNGGKPKAAAEDDFIRF